MSFKSPNITAKSWSRSSWKLTSDDDCFPSIFRLFTKIRLFVWFFTLFSLQWSFYDQTCMSDDLYDSEEAQQRTSTTYNIKWWCCSIACTDASVTCARLYHKLFSYFVSVIPKSRQFTCIIDFWAIVSFQIFIAAWLSCSNTKYTFQIMCHIYSKRERVNK